MSKLSLNKERRLVIALCQKHYMESRIANVLGSAVLFLSITAHARFQSRGIRFHLNR